MPPNRKLQLDVSDLDDELLGANATTEVEQNTAASPPLLTTTQDKGDNKQSDDDDADFFWGDIEENIPPQDAPKLQQRQQEHQQELHHSDDVSHPAHSIHRRVIRHLASKVEEPKELSTDARRLAQAVRDAGEYSSGVIACEVWMLQEEDHQLTRPTGGWWYDSQLMPNLRHYYEKENPIPVPPGVDVPGILWSELEREHLDLPQSRSGGSLKGNKSPPTSTPTSGGMLSAEEVKRDKKHSISFDGLTHLYHLYDDHQINDHYHHHHHGLVWRDLHSIAQDPDSAKTERFGDLLEFGLGAAAGLPFHVRDHRGIVIYYARNHRKKRHHLFNNVANDAYLRASADFIGHAAALSETRRASVESKRRHYRVTAKKFQHNLLLEYNRQEASSDTLSLQKSYPDQVISNDGDGRKEGTIYWKDASEKEDIDSTWKDWILHRCRTWCHKLRGGNLQIPPSMSLRQTLWTIFGSFCGLLVLSSLNEYYQMVSDDEYILLMGPFGALMTLQYGLTSAPASQPRNAVLGQAVCGATSLAFTYIPEWILATWLRRAVGPAFGIGAMVKLGLTHPPAGAHAVIYASGDYGFGFYALVVLSSAISIIPATLVNNMSLKRQYPHYWTLFKFPDKAEVKEWLGFKQKAGS